MVSTIRLIDKICHKRNIKSCIQDIRNCMKKEARGYCNVSTGKFETILEFKTVYKNVDYN